jgi:hypothetical protein
MSAFWWIVLAVAVLAFVLFARSKKNTVAAFSALDEAASWFASQGIDPKSVMFSSYQEAQLARVAGATVLVGNGTTRQGADVGFAIEVVPGRGVVASELLNPSGIATHHKTAAMEAKMSRRPLLTVLTAMAAEHRSRYPADPSPGDDPAEKIFAEASEHFNRIMQGAANAPATTFMAAMPHPEADKPIRKLAFEREQVVIDYYENPRSIGAVAAGIDQPFERPQVAVMRERGQPVLIVQVEKSLGGTLLLCALDPAGKHSNFGPFKPDPRMPPVEAFITQAIQIFRQNKQ